MNARVVLIVLSIAMSAALWGPTMAGASTIFYTACDGTSATDTVKVKKVEEDGTGGATLADTTIANCALASSTTSVTGLAVVSGHAYISWQEKTGASTGIARVGLDGTGLNLHYIDGPAGAQHLRLNSNVAGGYFYVYADQGLTPVDAQVLRVPVGGGTFTEVVAKGTSLEPLSFGVAGDYVYYSREPIVASWPLGRASLDGTTQQENFFGFTTGGVTPLTGVGSALVTATASRLIVLTSGGSGPGYSSLSPIAAPTTVADAVPVPATGNGVGDQVWSGSHLYFTQADNAGLNTAIGRVDEDGTNLKRDWLTVPLVHQIAVGVIPTPTPATPAALPTVVPTGINRTTTLTQQGGMLTAQFTCTTTTQIALESCKVQLAVNSSLLKTPRAKGKTTIIGTATKSAAGAASVKVKVRISNAKARRALAAKGSLRVTASITVTDVAGQSGTASKATTLIRPKKAKMLPNGRRFRP